MKASFLLFSLAIFQAIPMVSAAPITYVDEAADFVITTDNGTAGVLDAGDVVTWQPTAGPDVTGLVFGTTAFTSIQAAVDAADVDGTVRIAAGNYAEGAEIVLSKGLTVEGEGPDLTILSGGGDGDLNTVNPSAHRVMSLGVAAVCTVKNLAIVNGEYQGPPNVEGQRTLGGGGVYVGIFSTVTLENCKVSGNVSNTHGGGLHADNSGSATIKECTFEGNVTNGDGGGLYVAEGFLELLNSTFNNNIAFGSGGGGYYSVISSGSIDSHVYCCTFSNNHAGKRGGGFYGDYRWSDGVISNRILFSTFTGNTAGISQGGLWFSEKGVLGILSGILVVGNDAPNDPNTFYADPSTAFVSLGNLDHIGLDTPDQILEPLADNGGPTLTHYPLAPGSDGTYWTYYYTGLILEDQRGSGRHFGNNSGSESKFDLDWGAVEHKGIRLLSSSPGNGETVDLPPTSIAIHMAARRAGSESGSPPAPELTFGDLSQVVLRRQSNGQSIPVTVTTSLDPATGDTLNITPNAVLPVDDYSVEINGLIATHIYYPEETLGPLASPFMTFKISTASDVYVGASGDFTEDGSNVTFQAGTADEVPGLVLGESAFTDIQSAVDKVGTGGTVYIGPGAYDQGDQILVTRSMSLVGSGSAQTILSGGDSHRVFLIRNDADVVIRDMTITEGMANGTVYYGDGAAIYASGCSLTLDGVVVSESEAARVGGGIFMKNGELSIENSWIDSNRAGYLGFPGFSEAGGVYTENSTVSVSNSTLTGNETSGKGGGIYTRSGTITLSHSTMVGNQANAGGGIYNNGTLTLDSSTIRGNLADMGGGLFVNNGLVTLNNSTLAGNQADTGGGAYLYDGLVTIDPNSLDQDHAFFGYVDNGALMLNHSTISTNLAETGGGIYVESGPLSSTNSIIAGNTATISGPDLVGTIAAGSNNLTSGDPMLGPLADNGGPTWTMLPLPGSPAIDAGIDTGSLPATDQRGPGFYRISGGIVDIGAVEFRQGTPLLDWRILHGLDQAGSDDLGNPSGDGIANLLKYAFNMAPNAGDLELGNPSVMAPDGISGLPMIERTEEGRLSFTYVRRKASSSPGVSYQPQTSIDLSTWNPILFASSTVTSVDDEWERVTVVDPVSTDTRFGRVGVTD